MVSVRSAWSIPPCSDRALYWWRTRSWYRPSHFSCRSTKMSTLPSSNQSPRICSVRMNLSRSSMSSTCCSTVELTTERPPTTISRGVLSMPRARLSMPRGNVAEKSTVWRSGRTFWSTDWICGPKPRSSMRSASSMTTKVTRLRFTSLPACMHRMSIMRPGVHTTTCTPRLRSAIWLATCSPPTRHVVRRPSGVPYRRASA
mmetsp:Transcript_11378/g.38466  ORF Transcript_11378/g.38466 Transcript_11378/m.38466 type:complete len:201 (-) Transcript_11378:657-1259(-)